MRAVVYEKNGGPEVLNYVEIDDPYPSDQQVLIETQYISIEGGDVLLRKVSPPAQVPFVPGYQVSGTVVAVGASVTEFSVGQKVCAFGWSGSHAELFCTDCRHVFSLPDDIDMALASTIPVPFGTAADALFEFGQLRAGETVLIQGAAGGVGLAAVQLAARAGATVIGTSSSNERLDRLKEFGLAHGINYRTQDIGEQCLQITGGRGVDFVLDLAGGAGVAQLLEAVKYRGRYAIVGASTGDLPSFQFFDLIRKSLTVFGTSFGREMHTDRARNLVYDLIQQVADGRLKMPVEKVFALADAREAHRFVEQGHPFGRVLMTP